MHVGPSVKLIYDDNNVAMSFAVKYDALNVISEDMTGFSKTRHPT